MALTQTFVRVILKTEQTFGGVVIMFLNEQHISKREPDALSGLISSFFSYRTKFVKILGVLAAAFLIVIISLSISLLGAEQDAYASYGELTLKYEIVKGDTLWSIASHHVNKGKNVVEYLNEIKKLNGLTSSMLHEGQVLKLP
jgi:hypothetical protein